MENVHMENVHYMISDAAKQVAVESHVLRYWEEELKIPIKRNELGHRYYTAEDVERFKKIKSLKEQGLQLKAIRMILKNGKLERLGGTKQAVEELTGSGQDADGESKNDKETADNAAEGKAGVTEQKAAINKETRAAANKEMEAENAEMTQMTQENAQTEKTKTAKTRKDTKRTADGRFAKIEKTQAAGLIKQQAEKVEVLDLKEVAAMREESREEKNMRLQLLLQHLIADVVRNSNRELCQDIKETVLKEMDYQFRVQDEKAEERETRRIKMDEDHFTRLDELLRSFNNKKEKRKKHL